LVEQIHREQLPEDWEASPYPLAVQVISRYESDARRVAGRALARLGRRFGQPTGAPVGIGTARQVQSSQVATSKRGHEVKKTREWVDGATACAHLSTARTLEASKSKRP